jgi:lipoate-protein ligase A
MGRSEYKVPGGKLLRAKAEAEAGKIKFLQVSGDFFMSPETDLEELEAQLVGGSSDPEAVTGKVKAFFGERGTVITGASPGDFARIIIEALEG